MAQSIGAVGVGLPNPQALYPVAIPSIAAFTNPNRISLPPGGDIIIPPGDWAITLGLYSQVQFLDPVTQLWVPIISTTGSNFLTIESDGWNYRIYNPTGFPVGALITNAGTAYTSAPTIAAATGGSLWLAIVGGGIGTLNCPSTVTVASGVGYLVPPIINIAAPPSPGVQATAVCSISGGSIANFTIINPGAGYTSAPLVTAVQQMSDQNFQSGSTTATTQATIVAATSYVGMVTAVLLVNEGNNVANVAPTMSNTGGGGSGLAITPVMAFTVANYAIAAAGSGYNGSSAPVQTWGGSLATAGTSGIGAATNNPMVSYGMFIPRQAQIVVNISGGSASLPNNAINQFSGIIDGGLFQVTPNNAIVLNPTGAGGFGSLTLTMGGQNDTLIIQKLAG